MAHRGVRVGAYAGTRRSLPEDDLFAGIEVYGTTPMFVALTLLADKPSQTGPEFGKASPIGLLIVVLLLIATCVLVWSMNKHLKKLPETFDPCC